MGSGVLGGKKQLTWWKSRNDLKLKNEWNNVLRIRHLVEGASPSFLSSISLKINYCQGPGTIFKDTKKWKTNKKVFKALASVKTRSNSYNRVFSCFTFL